MTSSTPKIVIAVDGYSSCGKSTFARLAANRLGYIFIDTGAMYRAVTLYAMQHGAINNAIVDEEALKQMLDKIEIAFRFNPQRGASDIYVNGEMVEGLIRSVAVSNMVSAVSAIPEVRTKLVAMQQQLGRSKGVVMDGRDIGTVVFPDAELKIFMTADPLIRAERRRKELEEQGHNYSIEEVVEMINCRDRKDTSRAIAPLRKADDAIVLDNSSLTIEQEIDWLYRIMNERFGLAPDAQ